MKRSCFLVISIILILQFGNNTCTVAQTFDLNPVHAIITNNLTIDILGMITMPGITDHAGNGSLISAALYLTNADLPYPSNDPRQNQVAIIVADFYLQVGTTYEYRATVNGNLLPAGNYNFCYRYTINGTSYLGGAQGDPGYFHVGILSVITSVENLKEIPVSYMLSQNYPNPFNPSTIINYQLPIAGFVSLKVYNVLGKEVAILVNEYKQAGNHYSTFSITNNSISSGVYFYKLTTPNFSDTKKLVIEK
ncbi:MAG: T9SS type A sorting domain-containing protein [Ignavibacteriales bacterium]|nr:T9SS type A sorting domain-containing protein [Ignavibacteriales bacterium]